MHICIPVCSHHTRNGCSYCRVKEIYLARYKVELDHRRYGCSKMRDIATLLFADLAKVRQPCMCLRALWQGMPLCVHVDAVV